MKELLIILAVLWAGGFIASHIDRKPPSPRSIKVKRGLTYVGYVVGLLLLVVFAAACTSIPPQPSAVSAPCSEEARQQVVAQVQANMAHLGGDVAMAKLEGASDPTALALAQERRPLTTYDLKCDR